VLNDPVHNVQTFDFQFGDPAVDGDQLPGDGIANPPAWTPGAVSAHANAVAVSDFLRTVLRRDNIDGNGSPMLSTVNCVVTDASPGPKQWVNAFWNGRQMVYGQVLRGTELRSLSANIDVVAHEMFHGITDHTSRLEYAFQPGGAQRILLRHLRDDRRQPGGGRPPVLGLAAGRKPPGRGQTVP
jgi:Zn-dependent metalloprotease